MPKVNLRLSFVDNPPKPTDKPKTDYFDTQLTGLLLEVRRSGKATYHLRYRDKYGLESFWLIRQFSQNRVRYKVEHLKKPSSTIPCPGDGFRLWRISV